MNKWRSRQATMWLALVALSSPAAVPHMVLSDAVEYPVIAGFERFYTANDDDTHLTEGGFVLMKELNCIGCHEAPAAWRERLPAKPKISLANVGHRLSADSLSKFIRHPQLEKQGTLMPGLFADVNRAPEVVEALTVYLSSLKQPLKKFPPGNVGRGHELYHTIGCVACHAPAPIAEYEPTEVSAGAEVKKSTLLSIPMVLARKYERGALAGFLQNPLSIRHAGRMPSTEMTDQEAADIAAYLQRDPGETMTIDQPDAKVTEPNVSEGRKQFALQNCQACHQVNEPTELLLAKSVEKLDAHKGCLASPIKGSAPDFALSELQRRALTLALQEIQKQSSPVAMTAAKKVHDHLLSMNCYACHVWQQKGGVEEARAPYFSVLDATVHSLGEIGRLPPKLDGAGRKLTQAWMEKLLWGDGGCVRPYMTARMPRFGKENCADFIPLLAEASRQETPVTMDTSGLLKHHRAELGRGLMGIGKGGLGCVSCHGLKDRKSLGVPVVNLTSTVQRLQPGYFKELLLNPQATQPGTLMPPLFMGRPKAAEDIEALWTYLKELDQSRLPEGLLQVGDYELKPDKLGRPIVFRSFLEGAGMQAIAVGYPQGLSVAFDALEVRWALVWKGRFLDAMTTWEERAMTPAKPLGEKVVTLPVRMPLAKLTSPETVWPTVCGVEAGFHFKGFRMNPDGIPVFLYETDDLKIEDELKPSAEGTSLRRTVTLHGQGDDWYFQGCQQDALPSKVVWKNETAVFQETLIP